MVPTVGGGAAGVGGGGAGGGVGEEAVGRAFFLCFTQQVHKARPGLLVFF